jgi:hypothetical protein
MQQRDDYSFESNSAIIHLERAKASFIDCGAAWDAQATLFVSLRFHSFCPHALKIGAAHLSCNNSTTWARVLWCICGA